MIGCIVQARIGSTRLPGKVMLNIDEKNPVLYYVLEQLSSCKLIDKIIVATTTLDEDDVIKKWMDWARKRFETPNVTDFICKVVAPLCCVAVFCCVRCEVLLHTDLRVLLC